MVEKGAQVKLRRQLESLWVEHDQMKADHQAKVLELESLTWNHEKSRDHELELKGCLETSRAELAGQFYDFLGCLREGDLQPYFDNFRKPCQLLTY